MATSDAPLNVPNVTLAVARGAASSRAIVGSGFGAKQATTPTFDNFEGLPVGQLSAGQGTVGSLSMVAAGGASVENTARNGGKCVVNDFNVVDFPMIYKALSGSGQKGYMGCWFKRDVYAALNGTNPVWKFGRVGSGAVYDDNPKMSDEYTGSYPETGSGTLRDSGGTMIGYISNAANNSYKAPEPIILYPNNIWVFYELEYDFGTPGNEDCFFEVRVNGERAAAYYGPEGYTFLLAGSTAAPEWLLTPLNGSGTLRPVKLWLDDTYTDESRARVVMTNSAIYANATKWAVQPIESYSDTEVAYTQKRQDFAVGDTAYLHLFNDDGVLVESTGAITVGED